MKFFPITLLAFSLFALPLHADETDVESTPVVPAEQAETEQSAADEKASSEEQAYMEWARGLWESLNRQTGEIEIEAANATMNVPEDFYFLNGADAEKVLVDVWGNPPNQQVLGMLFPQSVTPFDAESWAVTVEYEQDGYVSDEDADKMDYQELLEQMQADSDASNPERIEMGYGEIKLVGWASAPFYDKTQNKMHWAKELNFDGAEANTLNYNIRVLGRKGVLVLNFIADMDQQATIEQNLDTVLAMANFDQGARYADFNPDVDEVAAYGLGALVAGKVLAKTGFLAVALVFLKKFGIFIVVGIGALLQAVFKRRKKQAA